MIHHGAFEHLAQLPSQPLAAELEQVAGPVVLFFGLLRPYKGVDVLLEAWRGIRGRRAVDRRTPADGHRAAARERCRPGVRFVPRFVADAELPAFFRRADVVVLPYSRTERFDQSGVLATALAFAKPVVLSDVGGFGEVAATGAAGLVAPGDAVAGGRAWSPAGRRGRARAAGAAARRPRPGRTRGTRRRADA